MAEVHYGVVQVGDRWTIIGDQLRFGAYRNRHEAERAATRLACRCACTCRTKPDSCTGPPC